MFVVIIDAINSTTSIRIDFLGKADILCSQLIQDILLTWKMCLSCITLNLILDNNSNCFLLYDNIPIENLHRVVSSTNIEGRKSIRYAESRQFYMKIN